MDISPHASTLIWSAWLLLALFGQLLVVQSNFLWKRRRFGGWALIFWYILSFGWLAMSDFSVWMGGLAAFLTLYMGVNVGRVTTHRFSDVYVRRTLLLNTWWLHAMLLVPLLIWWSPIALSAADILVVWSACCAVLGAILLIIMARAMRRFAATTDTKKIPISKLPTVTLAVGARNETHALEEMLQQVVASDYPKLEVIVLDDCSQDATAEVIRSFARDGVRFVQGKEPSDGWLGKNAAYATLAEEASGELLIFASVDTHFASHSISQIVSDMLAHKTEMYTILPFRRGFDVAPLFWENLRDFWQIVVSMGRRHMPVANQCWAIWAQTLRHTGGFAAHRHSVFPEMHIARTLFAKGTYRFAVATDSLGVTTRKRFSSQLETATRTYYPWLKRRPAAVAAATLALFGCLLLPFGLLAFGLGQAMSATTIFAALTVLGFVLAHITLLLHTSPRGWWLGIVNFPFVVLLDLLLVHWSMLQFEFGEVNWKGRNVCYPVMQTIPMATFKAAMTKRSK